MGEFVVVLVGNDSGSTVWRLALALVEQPTNKIDTIANTSTNIVVRLKDIAPVNPIQEENTRQLYHQLKGQLHLEARGSYC